MNVSNKTKIYILVVAIIVIAAAYYIHDRNYKGASKIVAEETKETEWGLPELAKQEAEKSAADLPVTSIHYTDPNLNISFDYPKGFAVSAFTEASSGDRTILIQETIKNIGVQITAMPFVDPLETLTESRIENDLDISISNYVPINIGKRQNIPSITFISGDSVKYREVWFVKNNTLFMVKAYQSSESLIVAILKTLEI